PLTGRTHQIRLHSSHQKGLASPIVGDRLYGNKGEKLMLQAKLLEFNHPFTKERLSFQLEDEF
ncbi:MAG: RNA pseudouridine synthase, partial [Sphaerochaetaceae bacterium]|nr:RNA pseudouridine synthase [Sphaerochaetaceae bacterium]